VNFGANLLDFGTNSVELSAGLHAQLGDLLPELRPQLRHPLLQLGIEPREIDFVQFAEIRAVGQVQSSTPSPSLNPSNAINGEPSSGTRRSLIVATDRPFPVSDQLGRGLDGSIRGG
jgi:hypothetical protein